MEDTHYHEVLQRAKDSRTAEPDGITPWMVTEHADWLDIRKASVESDVEAPRGSEHVQDTTDQTEQDPSAIVDRFKTDHSSVDINFEANSKLIEVLLFELSYE